MYTIGEFSKLTGLTVKALRFYDEQGVLKPAFVDPDNGYRYYSHAQVETAWVIRRLRELELPVKDIVELLANQTSDADVLDSLQRHRQQIQSRLKQYREIAATLDKIITQEREARSTMQSMTFEAEEKILEPLRIAGIRLRGRYADCGTGFARIGRSLGRYICGHAMLLHFDSEYKEDDADFEACMPVRSGASGKGDIVVRELPGGRCVSLMHQGPYDDLSRSYARILQYVKARGFEVEVPTREIYIKGPGMIFRGNPKRYLTEIQMLIRPRSSAPEC